jgi:hypothetical protein
MHLCACVSEEGDDGEGEGSEAISAVIHTWIRQSRGLGQTQSVWVAITDAPVFMREREGGERGGIGGGWGLISGSRSCRIRRVCLFCEHERGS